MQYHLYEYSGTGYFSGIGFYVQRILCQDSRLLLRDVEIADAQNSYKIVTSTAAKERLFRNAF
jgi:hypothetical protein